MARTNWSERRAGHSQDRNRNLRDSKFRDLKFRIGLVTFATLAALGLFVYLGRQVIPADAAATPYGGELLTTAFLLNIALILFGWVRSKELRRALDAHAEAEQRAQESAFCDHVTGLWNRRELIRVIEARARKPAGQATILLLDLDHFKNVNDLYGHAAGDRLLEFVARTLEDAVGSDACCSRLGGDEFAILLPGPDSKDRVEGIAQTILDTLFHPEVLEETTAHISASIGIATLGKACREAETLLRHADIAMYEAKRNGRNCFVWFEPEMELLLQRRNKLESEMRDGIARGEFVPFYQPLISLDTGDVIGFEVLARWNHPERGLVEPMDFIPVAEATHLIAALSMNVMRQALNEAKSWPADTTLAVNISPVQFKDPLLAQRIIQLLTETGFPAKRLEIELTESSLLDDHEQALATVHSLKNNGISISLDDFGTGYASLTHLKVLPFDRIKIDRSFVSALLEDEQSNAIVNTIANLGQSLRLPITAEGVESEGVRAQLQMIGCSDAQGWLFGKAVPAGEIRTMLAKSASELAEKEASPSIEPKSAQGTRPTAIPQGRRRKRA